jgi:hypothetical protein
VHPVAPKKPAPEKPIAVAPKKVEMPVRMPKGTAKRKGNGHAEEGWQEF